MVRCSIVQIHSQQFSMVRHHQLLVAMAYCASVCHDARRSNSLRLYVLQLCACADKAAVNTPALIAQPQAQQQHAQQCQDGEGHASGLKRPRLADQQPAAAPSDDNASASIPSNSASHSHSSSAGNKDRTAQTVIQPADAGGPLQLAGDTGLLFLIASSTALRMLQFF